MEGKATWRQGAWRAGNMEAWMEGRAGNMEAGSMEWRAGQAAYKPGKQATVVATQGQQSPSAYHCKACPYPASAEGGFFWKSGFI